MSPGPWYRAPHEAVPPLSKLATAQAELAQVKAELDDCHRSERLALRERVTVLQGEITSAKLAATQAELAQVVAELEDCHRSERSTLRDKIAALQAEAAALKAALPSSEAARGTAQ